MVKNYGLPKQATIFVYSILVLEGGFPLVRMATVTDTGMRQSG